MLFGFVCFCRGSPNNPELFRALKAVKVEGVKVDSLDYIFIKTASGISNEQIMMTLSTFGIRPVSTSNDSPEILTSKSCSRQQRQSFFRHIRFHRARYHQGLETCYWYWLQPPLDTLGNPLPPPVGAYEIDPTPSSRWQQYWDRCPGGEYCTQAIVD